MTPLWSVYPFPLAGSTLRGSPFVFQGEPSEYAAAQQVILSRQAASHALWRARFASSAVAAGTASALTH